MNLQTKIKNRAFNVISQTSGLNLPKAMLIIPDGNGRWAKKMGLNISEGHLAGGKTISQVLDHFMQIDIEVLGIWGFSEDNWKRPQEEIEKVMEVIEIVIKENKEKMIKNNIKFVVLGKEEKIRKEFPILHHTLEDVTTAS